MVVWDLQLKGYQVLYKIGFDHLIKIRNPQCLLSYALDAELLWLGGGIRRGLLGFRT